MTTDEITKKMKSEIREIGKLKKAQKNGDARLGDEKEDLCPRGLRRRMNYIRERIDSITFIGAQIVRRPFWIVKLVIWLWNIIRRYILGKPTLEPEPKGWPPSWGILLPSHSDLRQAWKERFGLVMVDMELLNGEAAKNRDDTEQYKLELMQLPDRLEKTRRIKLRRQPTEGSLPELHHQTVFARIVEFLRTWRMEVLFEPKPPASTSRVLLEPESYIVTLDDLLNENIGRPLSEVEIQKKFNDPMSQYQMILNHIKSTEGEIEQ